MGTQFRPHISDSEAEMQNILCCLRFLAREAMTAKLQPISAIICETIERISALGHVPKASAEQGFAELVRDFSVFMRLYILGTPAMREDLKDMISKLEAGRLAEYAH